VRLFRYRVEIIKITNMQEKVLKVIKPFFVMDCGDTFELSQNGKEYTSTYVEEGDATNDSGVHIGSKYTSNYTISTGYAQELINEGYLAPLETTKPEGPFVNVFDEIDDMLAEYNEELNNIDDVCANQPACLKVEHETVLRNICTVLEHLKSLKK